MLSVLSFVVDIGCGESKLEGALGIDLRVADSVDLVADGLNLPFRDGAVDHVFSSYLIEHYGHRVVEHVLIEWVRVLKRGGFLEIRAPNLRSRALLFVLNPTWHSIVQIFGEQDHLGNFHKSGFTKGILKDLVRSAGIVNIRDIFESYRGIPFIPRCIHVIGQKN